MKEQRRFLVLGALFFISIVLLVGSFYLFLSRPLMTKSYDVVFIVSRDKAGFDLNTSALTFGEIPQGASSSRRILIENTYAFPLRVTLYESPTLVEYLETESSFVIEPGERKNVSVVVRVPLNASEGTYTGTLSFRMYREK